VQNKELFTERQKNLRIYEKTIDKHRSRWYNAKHTVKKSREKPSETIHDSPEKGREIYTTKPYTPHREERRQL